MSGLRPGVCVINAARRSVCAQDTVWAALHNVSFRQSACHWRSSENTHTHEPAREAGPQGVRAAWPTPPVRSGPRGETGSLRVADTRARRHQPRFDVRVMA